MYGSAPGFTRRRSPCHRRHGAAAALVVLALARVAAAQTQEEIATRRILIERATAERAAGNHRQALALAQRAGAVQMTPSVRLFIAQEMDATGDPAGALGAADLCVRDVERDPTVPHRAALLATCSGLLRATRARIGYLVVRAPTPAPEGIHVTVRGADLVPSLFGVPNAVSPGNLLVEASAPGRVSFSTHSEVRSGATVEIDLALPPEPVAPPEPPTPTVVAQPPENPQPTVTAPVVPAPVETPPVVTAPALAPSPPPSASPSRLAPGLLLGGGAAALAAGAVLLLVRAGALEGCTVQGGTAVCDTAAELDAARSANGLAAGAVVLLGVGVAAVGAGVAWLLLDHRGPVGPPLWTANVLPSRGGVVFSLGARLP